MFNDLKNRIKKIGQPPGTPLYTGDHKETASKITAFHYTADSLHECPADEFEKFLPSRPKSGTTWINIAGLNNLNAINQIAKHYQLHPLTLEDILNTEQRPKVEEFPDYYFITLKALRWDTAALEFSTEQISLVFGAGFVLSFQERATPLFNPVIERLRAGPSQRVRQQNSDYLAYRLMDVIIDQYFIVLEGISDQMEEIEKLILTNPTSKNAQLVQQLKRQILLLRKAIWPMREALSHLLQDESKLISTFTRIYLRDLYDHIIQAIDTIETFREMASSIMDVYLSSLTNRMNEIMKVLTIIATIFIPITFITSLYGMNFKYMPELQWHFGYPAVLGVMSVVVLVMLSYFRRKKWL